MREILFRGKRIDNGEWVKGVPINTHIGTFIVFEKNPHYCTQYGYMEITGLCMVIPETVGQCTGVPDRNGKQIFRDDYCYLIRPGTFAYGIIKYIDGCYWFVEDSKHHSMVRLCDLKVNNFEIKIIGNIHDNPELLEVTE